MKIAIKKATRAGGIAAAAAAMVAAGLLLALAVTPQEAEATFPGNNGKIAFASNRTAGEGVNNPEGDFEIFTMNPDGMGLRQLTENAAFDFDPEWSPDGRRIAFESDRGLFSEIFVMDADGTQETQVTTNPDFSFDRSPTFSADGQRIAFGSNRAAGVDNPERDAEIFAVNIDGTGLTQLTRNAARELHPDYSPDGRKIAFVSDRDFAPGIYTMDDDGTNQRKRSRGSGTAHAFPSWSPDGKRIAYMSNENGPDDIHSMGANGSRQERLTDNSVVRDSSPVYSPDGTRLAFSTDRDGNFEVYEMRTDGTSPANLTKDPAADLTPDWQPLKNTR